MNKTLTIIIPVYNEDRYISRVLKRINEVQLPDLVLKEVIVVDDCSTDNTSAELLTYKKSQTTLPFLCFRHEKNQGKGAAVHTGIKNATGDFIVVQDADMEYDPADFTTLLQPLLSGAADVVYGSRFIGDKPHRVLFFWHYVGNRFLTLLSNAFTNLNLTDMETGYKMFRREIIQNLRLREKRFGFEPEVTAKISKLPDVRIYEVGISYYGRTYKEGKKINWKDGFRAIYCIMKYALFR